MDLNDGSAEGDDENEKCFKCKIQFDDVKTVIKCTVCMHNYHGKCENVDLRGFHMRKDNWKCAVCYDAKGGEVKKGRKRSRVEWDEMDGTMIAGMNTTLELLVKKMDELNVKVDNLLAENNSLKQEIASLRESRGNMPVSLLPTKPQMAYSTVVKKDNKILVVKQKGDSEKNITKIKEDLRNKVSPVEMGVGLQMGRSTKNGGLIISCGDEKNIENVQSEIQSKLGDNYEVDRPKLRNHRIKVVGVNEDAANESDEDIVNGIMKQNYLDTGKNDLKVLRRTKVFNRRFNLVFEVDSNTYQIFMDKEKMNIGWNRCPVYSDYGIIRCFKCCKYGHLAKDCKETEMCPRCGGAHESKDCKSDEVKCPNCVQSNNKYGMRLSTDHTAWDIVNCQTYQRVEQIQRNKFFK